jgi:molybdopterin/thiamine biosynthesis adenylyltransferase
MRAFVIGIGGGGSILSPILCKLIGAANVCLIDGDKLEKRNLDRQMFGPEHIGRNKADAMAEMLGCSYIPEYYFNGIERHSPDDWLLACVDNHPARVSVLAACDEYRCDAVFASNEVLSSEAYLYRPEWKGTKLDPRVMYPEIVTDRSGDPRGAQAGCTGEAQKQTPQLVTANLMSASLALHLLVVWAMESKKLARETLEHLPHKLVCNMTRMETFKAQTKQQKQKRTQ